MISRTSSIFLLLAMVLAVSISVSVDNDFDFEEIKDLELNDRVAQAAEDGEAAEGDNSKAPAASLIAKEKRLPYPLCGVFILCERRGGFYGFPDAQLFKAFGRGIRVRTIGACRTAFVRGTSPGGVNQLDHARLWPLYWEEFNEMCFYHERQHACTSGQVTVVNSSGATLYKCDKYYDAHTVTFCLSKYPYFCRYRNPAEVIFATVSPVRA